MLPSNGQKLVQSLHKTINVAGRSLASSVLAPLTDPLEDDAIISTKTPSQKDVQISTLDNGIKVASLDNGGGVSRVVVAVKGGSRFESPEQLGLSHIIKNAAFLTNGGRTQLRTVRETQQSGGSLECSSSREFLSRSATFLRATLPEVMENIAPGITSPQFNDWEMDQVLDQCQGDIANVDSTGLNLEHLHKAAFRNGLGNSVYCSDQKLNSYSTEVMAEYVNRLNVGRSVTVVGTDVDHDSLVRYSNDLLGGLPTGEPSISTPQQYHSGESHVDTSTGLTYASLVGAGASLSGSNLPAFAVLQRILGYGTSIKWGSNSVSSRLNQAVAAATSVPFLLSSLNISYSDAGLFGMHAVAAPANIGAVLKAAVDEVGKVSNGDVSAEEVERAKNQVKATILMLSEGADEVIDDLIKQIAFTGGYVTPTEIIQKIDDVSADQVVDISKQLFGKSTLAVTGDTAHAPYLDEIL